ncbi:hypothetical protein [Acinetobacter baumannii]|uniref:hypothetical protein n=1 Tax=Acinetobacter baumannii TaxID=470 RepID=UPI001D178B93|nr:hypothetical protein [Acinetobacter baumannii]
MLKLFTEQLAKNGILMLKPCRLKNLKGRHVIINCLSNGVKMVCPLEHKKSMVAVRWWAEKVGNSGAVKDNATYKIENRVYVTNENKSISLKDLDLSKTDPNIAQSLRLQDAFGL